MRQEIPIEVDDLARRVADAAFNIRRAQGSGLLEPASRIGPLESNPLIVGLKSVDQLLPVLSAQLLTNSRLSGLLINFNAPLVKYGIKRIAL